MRTHRTNELGSLSDCVCTEKHRRLKYAAWLHRRVPNDSIA